MGNTIHFVSGMPRAGSTLLCNILAQNPRFHATATSGIFEVIIGVRNNWENISEFQAAPNPEGKVRVMRGILNSYHGNVPQPVVFDKSRGWLAFLETAELLLQRKAKVLVPVRPISEVLASFEKLWRTNKASMLIAQEQKHFYDFQTVEGRCNVWMKPEQPVGIAVSRIRDALLRGFSDRLHFVHFEKLAKAPGETMNAIYEFLGEKPFNHDFDNVEQVTWEDDTVRRMPGMHTIRPKVEYQPCDARKILGPIAEKYRGPYPWDSAAI